MFDTSLCQPYLLPPMFTRFLTIGSLFVSLFLAFGAFSAKAEASYYYDESYYNWPVPCYQYDGNGHCVSSSNNRYRSTSNRQYRYNGQYTYPNDSYYGNNDYGNSYNRYDNYRPVTNYYRSQRNNGCYWYYGTYRCDRGCNN
jgi:hypothetical protein